MPHNKYKNPLTEGFLWFMIVELIMIAIIWFNASVTSQLLVNIGITLSYFPFVGAWFIIISLINVYMNLLSPLRQNRRKGLIR